MILVIDDDEISLSVISMLLEAEGHPVTQATSGDEAIGLVKTLSPGSSFALVLADLQMPGTCGPELASMLRTQLPGVPLVAMSATPGDVTGYDGFVRKPLEVSQVLAHLPNTQQREMQAAVSLKHEGVLDAGILDEVVYGRLSRMMPQPAVDEIYDACLEDALHRVKRMEEAVEQGDLTEIRRHAHAIKGSAGMVGARNLADAASEIETCEEQTIDIPAKIGNLLCCCEQLKRILLDKRP